MRILLILFLWFFTFGTLVAQTGFSWGVHLYPSLSDRRLVNTGGRLSEKAIAKLDQLEKGIFSYGAGLDMQWLGETVGFNVGLRLRTAGYRTGLALVPPGDPNSDFADETEARYRQNTVEMPLEMLFFFRLDPGNAIFFTMGSSFSYQLHAENELTLYRNNTSETRIVDPEYEFRSLNYAFQTGIGWQTQLSDKLLLYIQPDFQFWFKGIYEDRAEINRNLYNLGVKVGLHFFRASE